MKAGDMIRVEGDWPGTRGRRFKVIEVKETVHAVDDAHRHRWFPAERCHVDRAETRARREA